MPERPPGPTPTPFEDCQEAPDLGGSMELVRRAQDGDRGALEELFERYRPRLLRIVRARMGAVLSRRLEAEDLVQEALLAAVRGFERFELRTHAGILRWLARIAENRIRDAVEHEHRDRRDARRLVQPGAGGAGAGGSGDAPFDPPDDGPRPSQIVARSELEELVDHYVGRLEPEDFRRVILLRDYFGASWEEVREELDRPTLRACEGLYYRAHVRLRRLLRPHVRDALP